MKHLTFVCKGKNFLHNISKIDWFIFLTLLAVCFVSFQQQDIWHTGGASIAYLQGHILDFYEITPDCNYLPTTFALFAVWNIPIYLLKWIVAPIISEPRFLVRMWYKLGTTILYFATARLMYKIGRAKGMSMKNANWLAFLFITNPIAVYSQFIFGQYDIITTFFMTLGLYYYLKDNNKGFVASFAVALTCKYFALLIFIPMLLMKEKKIWAIMKSMIGLVSLFIIEVLIYYPSEDFRESVFGFSAAGYAMFTGYETTYAYASIIPIIWIVVCGICYFWDFENDEKEDWLFFFINVVLFLTFGLSFWHPQWLLLGVPFWTITLAKHKKQDMYILLDVIMYIAYILFTGAMWQINADQYTLVGGILKNKVEPYVIGPYTMQNIIGVDRNLLFSSFIGLLLLFTILSLPRFAKKFDKVEFEQSKKMIRIRYVLSVLVFSILAFICVYKNANL